MTFVPKETSAGFGEYKWPATLPVSLFCLVVVFGALLQFVLDLTEFAVPIQALARIALLAAALPVLVIAKKYRHELAPFGVRLAAVMVFYSAVIAFLKDYFESSSVADPAADFIFMYGIGALLILAALVPLSARFRAAFFMLSSVSIGFGLLQLVTQDLHLPVDYLESLGLVYENFVNNRVRVVSFFRSAPRFAEFLTIVSLFVLAQIIRPTFENAIRWRVLLIVTFGLLAALLFNTYSRAGYILFVSSSIFLLYLVRRPARRAKGFRIPALYFLSAATGVGLVLALLDKLPVDRAIFDMTSYRSRQSSWSLLTERISNGSVSDLVFGLGETARFVRGDSRYYIIDNLTLALVLYGGLFALLCAVSLTIAVVRFAFSVRRIRGTAVEPWIAFIPCLWLEGFFVDNHNTLFIALLAAIGSVSAARRRSQLETVATLVHVANASDSVDAHAGALPHSDSALRRMAKSTAPSKRSGP